MAKRTKKSKKKTREVTVAATQMACEPDIDKNLEKAESLVRNAREEGAQIVLIQELFATPYFCKDQDPKFFALAEPVEDSPTKAMALMAGCSVSALPATSPRP